MSSQPSSALPEAHWRPTGALSRALVTAAVAIAAALLVGDPSLVVIGVPFVLLATLGLMHRPSGTPRLVSQIDHQSLHEGQGTTSRLVVEHAEDVEYLTRASGQPPYVVMRPASGYVGALLPGPVPDIEVSPRRWGRRMLGEEKVALFTPWGGYRFGPVAARRPDAARAPDDRALRLPRRGAAAARAGRCAPVAPHRQRHRARRDPAVRAG